MALGQFTGAVEDRLEVGETYEDIDGELDVIRLLLLIKIIA